MEIGSRSESRRGEVFIFSFLIAKKAQVVRFEVLFYTLMKEWSLFSWFLKLHHATHMLGATGAAAPERAHQMRPSRRRRAAEGIGL